MKLDFHFSLDLTENETKLICDNEYRNHRNNNNRSNYYRNSNNSANYCRNNNGNGNNRCNIANDIETMICQANDSRNNDINIIVDAVASSVKMALEQYSENIAKAKR